jgi:hypothetical protein
MSTMTVWEVCFDLIRHPIRRVIHRWHWKSATLSAIIRGSLFFATNLADGPRLATRAALVEFALRVPLIGILAAVTQAFGGAEPPWAAAIVATALLPGLAHLAEFAAHRMARTPELGTSIQGSVAMSVLSTSFSLFAMRRGVMIVGRGSRSFGSDLRHLPRLVLEFICVLPRALARVLRRALMSANVSG